MLFSILFKQIILLFIFSEIDFILSAIDLPLPCGSIKIIKLRFDVSFDKINS